MTIPVWTPFEISEGTVYIIFGGIIMPIEMGGISYTDMTAPDPTYVSCEAPDPTYVACTAPMPTWTENEA